MHLKHGYHKLMSHLRLSPLSISSGSSEAMPPVQPWATKCLMLVTYWCLWKWLAQQLLLPPFQGPPLCQKISTADVNPQIWVYSTVREPNVFHPRGSSAPNSTLYSSLTFEPVLSLPSQWFNVPTWTPTSLIHYSYSSLVSNPPFSPSLVCVW